MVALANHLFLSGLNLLSSAILLSCRSSHVFLAASSICGTNEFQKAQAERAAGAADTTARVRSGRKVRYLRPLDAEYRGQASSLPSSFGSLKSDLPLILALMTRYNVTHKIEEEITLKNFSGSGHGPLQYEISMVWASLPSSRGRYHKRLCQSKLNSSLAIRMRLDLASPAMCCL